MSIINGIISVNFDYDCSKKRSVINFDVASESLSKKFLNIYWKSYISFIELHGAGAIRSPPEAFAKQRWQSCSITLRPGPCQGKELDFLHTMDAMNLGNVWNKSLTLKFDRAMSPCLYLAFGAHRAN